MLSSQKEIQRGAVLSSINTILGIISTIMITPAILEALGPEGMGLYNTVGAITSAMMLLNFGLNGSMVRFISKYRAAGDKEGESRFYGMSVIIFIGISVLMAIVGIIFMFNIHKFRSVLIGQAVEARLMMLMTTISLVFTMSTQVFPSAMTANEKYTFLRGWELFRNIAAPLIKIAFIATIGINALIIVTIDVAFNFVYQIIVILYTKFGLKIKFRFRGIKAHMFKELLSYSFYIFISIFVDVIYWKTDTFVLAAVSDNQQIADLSIAFQFSDYFIRIASMLCGMLMVRVVNMVVHNASGKTLTDLMIKMGRIQMLILGLILTGYILCGRHFINQYAPGPYYHARIYYMGLMVLIPLLIPEIQILGISILQAKGMHKFRSLTYLCVAVVNILVSIPLAKKYGSIGAAAGTCGALIIGQIIIMNWYYKNRVGIEIGRFFRETFHGTLPAMLISLAAGCVVFLLPAEGLPSLFMKIGIVTVIYCVLQWLIGMNRYEKELIRTPFKRLKNKFQH